MQDRRSNAFYQLLFIILIYIEYPLMIFLVMDGVSEMDLHHIMYIVAFILYTLWPMLINRFSIVLLIYADFFIFIKYFYSLWIKNNDSEKNWMLVVGIQSNYDTSQTQEYFRYMPRFDQWFIIFLSLLLYRRQIVLSSGN